MPVNIEAYRRAVTAAETEFRLSLAGGRASADDVALRRLAWDIMRTELTTAPNSVLIWERMPPQPPLGLTGADAWAAAAWRKANSQIHPQYGSADQLNRKHEEYLRLAEQMLQWGQVRQQYPILKMLDEHAIGRVLAKGPSVDHLKGQLLEELIESRVVPWLSSRGGGFALGIMVPAGKKLEFIPGHLVRDTAGRQISDGLLAYRDGERLMIAVVFEAKAGKRCARELSLKRGTLSSLTDAERKELRANAKDVWREQRDTALAAGKPFKKTLDDVEKEYALSELGGQVRRDVERLTDAEVRVGTETFPVTISPTRTKFFGVLPRDVRAATIEKELKEAGFNYEIIGADIRSKDLVAAGDKLKPLAEKLADLAP